ncbi:MAG: hypothetical protein AB8B65_13555 [Kordia sp.]|uniref:hypothetical protein n=1 Tax=Kordia sp. TaxID=1965332 RepID=UPI0038594544
MLSILFLLFFTHSFSQNEDRTYLAHGHSSGPDYSYSIREISIHSDSTYTSKNYQVDNKKEWKNYKQYTPRVSKGFIIRKGKFFILTENKDNPESFFSWTVKIKDKKLLFFYPNRRGILKRSAVYKRIDAN